MMWPAVGTTAIDKVCKHQPVKSGRCIFTFTVNIAIFDGDFNCFTCCNHVWTGKVEGEKHFTTTI